MAPAPSLRQPLHKVGLVQRLAGARATQRNHCRPRQATTLHTWNTSPQRPCEERRDVVAGPAVLSVTQGPRISRW